MIFTIIAKFSTYDNDNDKAHFTCAITSKRGWWYYVCDAINPNECLPMGKQGKTCHGGHSNASSITFSKTAYKKQCRQKITRHCLLQ